MSARWGAAVGLALVLIGIAVYLLSPTPGFLAANGAQVNLDSGIVLPSGARACQSGEEVPADAGRVRLIVSTAGHDGGPLALSVTGRGGRQVTSGRVDGGYRDSPVSVPISRVRRAVTGAQVCAQNRSRISIALLGSIPTGGQVAASTSNGVPQASRMRLEWYRAQGEPRIAAAPQIARRMALEKASFFGPWTSWLALVIVIVSAGAAVWLVLRVLATREREDAQADPLPGDDARTDRLPGDDARADRLPGDDARADRLPGDDARADRLPGDDARADRLPGDDARADRLPGDDARTDPLPGDDARADPRPGDHGPSGPAPDAPGPYPLAAGGFRLRTRRLRAPRLLRRLASAYWACVALAAVNALVWAFVTPTFQGPDEPLHAGYVEYLAESGSLPRPDVASGSYYAPPADALAAYQGIPFNLNGSPSWSQAHNAAVQRELDRPLSRKGDGGAGYVVNNPPLYYALAAVPYELAHSANFFDRLYAMRLLSVLLAGLTAGFVYLFVRELLPRTPWVAVVGGLGVGFQPVFGFMSGTVNNDDLLWTVCAAAALVIARCFRRGLNMRRGLALGLLLAAGILTKGSMFGFVPGIGLALVLLIVRAARAERRRALLGAVVAAWSAALPVAIWLVVNHAVAKRATTTTTSGLLNGTPFLIRQYLSYLWQSYLPRLPGMTPEFPFHAPGFPKQPPYPLWDPFFQGLVGRFGWFQYGFPLWVNQLALIIWVPLLGLAAAALARLRRSVRPRWPELLTYLALVAGVIGVVAAAGYRYRLSAHISFEQTRYLFPLLALYGALLAFAVRGARRLAPALAALVVVFAVGHNAFAQMLTVDRFYSAQPPPPYVHGKVIANQIPHQPASQLPRQPPGGARR